VTDEFRSDETVHLEREYAATPDEVWDAWTNPERLARWLGAPSAPVLGAAAPVRLNLGDGADEWADVTVIAVDPPRLLELSWAFEGESGSVLRVEIEPVDADRTRVLVEHRGLGSSVVGYGAGWQAYLDGGLAQELGEHVPVTKWDKLFEQALPVWRERAAAQRTTNATG
jgi:uncharacterized protein YndB with AHSA1/START domain